MRSGRSSREKLVESFQLPSLSLYSRENETVNHATFSGSFGHTVARTRPTLNSLAGFVVIPLVSSKRVMAAPEERVPWPVSRGNRRRGSPLTVLPVREYPNSMALDPDARNPSMQLETIDVTGLPAQV